MPRKQPARPHGLRALGCVLLLHAFGIAPAAICEPVPRRSTPPPSLEGLLSDGWVQARVTVPSGEGTLGQEVLESLEKELRSLIVFRIRFYAPARGSVALLGDELLAELTVTRTAQWDPIMRLFRVTETVNGEEREPWTGTDTGALLRAFLEVGPLRLYPAAGPPPAGSYLRALYRFSPVQLDGSLSIIALFYDVGARQSPWARASAGGLP